METPFVSILLPVYNGSSFIRETVDSLLNQTFSNFELIIINDCSTDSTLEILSTYEDNRIQIVTNSQNEGLISVLNKGINLSKGDYIVRIDADDIAMIDRIEKQLDFLEKNSDYVLVGSAAKLIYNEHKTEEVLHYYTEHSDLVFAMGYYCPIIHPSVMLRTSIIKENQLYFDYAYKHAEDYAFWTKIIHFGKFKNLSESLIYYRKHTNQISEKHTETQIEITEKIRRSYVSNYLFDFSNEEIDYLFFDKCVESVQFKFETLLKFDRDTKMIGEAKVRFIHKKIKNLYVDAPSLLISDIFRLLSAGYFWRIKTSFTQKVIFFTKIFKSDKYV